MGIILDVTPRITPDGMIVIETIATKSKMAATGVPISIDPTGTVISAPIFDIAEARTTVAIPDGQTIVLGGMITKSEDTLERKVPWLADIPVLGHAFRYDGTQTRRTELLIFLTPRVIRSDADSELIKQIEVERLHFFEQDAEEIHGPIFAVPPQVEMPNEPLPKLPEGGVMPAPPAPAAEDVPTTSMPGDSKFLAPTVSPQGAGQAPPQGWSPTGAGTLKPVPGTGRVDPEAGQSRKKRGLLSSFIKPLRTPTN